jgi:hypothetical protein
MPTTFQQAPHVNIFSLGAIHAAENVYPVADALIKDDLPFAANEPFLRELYGLKYCR